MAKLTPAVSRARKIASHRRWASYWARQEDAAKARGDAEAAQTAYSKRRAQIEVLGRLETGEVIE